MANNVTIPTVGTGDTTPKVSTDQVTADQSQVQNVQQVSVSGGVITRNPTVPVSSAASSQVDGHSATIGALADASSANTLVGLLKNLKAALAGTLTVSGTVTTTPPSNASTNLAQVAGATVATGHGTAAGSVRVELPTDGTGVVGLAAGAATVGTVNLGTISTAATAAKQPAIGTAGTPSVDVLSIQGVAGGTAIPVTGGGTPTDATASKAATVANDAATATGLNGASTVVTTITGSFTGLQAVHQVSQDGTNWFTVPSWEVGSPKTIFATAIAGTGNYIAQVAGWAQVRMIASAIATGTANFALRVSSGAVTAQNAAVNVTGTASTNIAQMNGVTTTMGNGASGTGVQRVTIANDSTGQIAVVNPTATLAAGSQVSVTATPGTVLSAATYKSVMFRNSSASASSVFIGPATVSATTGMEIKPGEFLGFGPGECPSNLIQGVCVASGTATLIVQTAS